MSETTDKTMSLVQARAMLGNTRALSSEQIDAAQRIVNSFYASNPRKACAACGCMIWSEHNGGVWGCDRCHRGPEVTQVEFNAAETARRKAADEHLRATEAAAPKPRDVLRERLAAVAATHEELAKLEKAAPVARSRVWELQVRVEAAEAAAEEANTAAASGLAAALAEGKSVGPSSAGAKARAELADAVDALSVAKNARVIVEEKLKAARSEVDFTFDKCRKAARTVIAAERLEDLLDEATEARANYLESVGQIGWLLRNHAVPDGDARPRQVLGDANTPPSAWREAANAGTAPMEDALAALLNDPEAPI